MTIIGDIVGPIVPERYWDSLADTRSPDQSAGEDDSESNQGARGGTK